MRLMVVTTPDLAPGFRLAGVETFAVENVEQAEEVLRRLAAGEEAGLIVVRRALLHGLAPRLRRRLENSTRPVVMDIPGGLSTPAAEGRGAKISELIRRTVGFQITFGADSAPAENE